MLSASNRAAKRKELETKNEQLQTRAREIQQRMGQRERELLQPMQERLTAIIDGIRAEGNYAMIIDLGRAGTRHRRPYDKTSRHHRNGCVARLEADELTARC